MPFSMLQSVIEIQRVTYIKQNMSTAVPHPILFWVYSFVKVTVLNAYHIDIDETEVVNI